jgi:hypothetical protein
MESNDLCFAGTVFLPSTECRICSEAEQGKMTAYADPRAHTRAHFHAVKVAEIRIDRRTTSYLKDYLVIYRREYQPIYDVQFEIFRREYYRTLIEKYRGDPEFICIFHLEAMVRHSSPQSKE